MRKPCFAALLSTMVVLTCTQVYAQKPKTETRPEAPDMSWTMGMQAGESDGATGATDIWTESFWVHDLLCERHTWDSGEPCTSKQAAEVLADILWREKRYLRSLVWYLAVRCFGPRF